MLGTSSHLHAPRRRFAVAVVALVAALAAGAAGSSAAQAATKRLPTPTRISISTVEWDRFSLAVGGSTTKFYSVYLNGLLRIGLAEGSALRPIVVGGLSQRTTYSVQVQEVVPPRFANSSLLSSPRSVTTAAYVEPVLPNAPAGLAAGNVTSVAADVAWNPVSGASEYRVYHNGKLVTSTTATTARIAPVELYPQGTSGGLTPGQRNRVGVAAVVNGVASRVSQISVQAAGSTPNAPTVPRNLRITGASNISIDLAWDAATSPLGSSLTYDFIVDGVFRPSTCSIYTCLGSTFNSVGGFGPGTSHRIGVRAHDSLTGLSSEFTVDVTGTTATP